jgi:hypothetical protein
VDNNRAAITDKRHRRGRLRRGRGWCWCSFSGLLAFDYFSFFLIRERFGFNWLVARLVQVVFF